MVVNSRMDIVQIPAGPLATNAFLVSEKLSGHALIIDAPPDSLALIEQEVVSRGVEPVALVITHGHWDHIVDAAAVRDRFTVPVLVHDLDRSRLEQPSHEEIASLTPDRILHKGDTVDLGEIEFEVLHTPGHCPGQVSLYSAADSTMFGGDTLFPSGYGTVEVPGASEEDTVQTIRRLLELPDETIVYPGHGRSTTIGRERPWMVQVAESGQLA